MATNLQKLKPNEACRVLNSTPLGAVLIRRGRDRTLHPRYAALASHFLFAPRFCLPATPQEKARVVNRVKDLERMWATPVPVVKDLDELNAHLRRCCRQAREPARVVLFECCYRFAQRHCKSGLGFPRHHGRHHFCIVFFGILCGLDISPTPEG